MTAEELKPASLHSARQLDEETLVRIFDRYAPALYRYAVRLGSNPSLADQIVGDVFANLLERFATGNGPTSNLRSYLYQSTYHCLVDETRYAKRRAPLESIDWQPYPPETRSRFLEDKLLFEQVTYAVQHELTSDQRHVIVLRFLEEFSLRETALILGKQVGNVKVIQNRALTRLRTSLEKHNVPQVDSSWRLPVPSPLAV